MNERKLQHRAREQEESRVTSSQEQTVREFASVEELIRHDAAQTEVPPALAEKIRETMSREPAPARPWWRRIWGG
jgi:hypothetical protein